MNIQYKNKLRYYLHPTPLISWNMSLPCIFFASTHQLLPTIVYQWWVDVELCLFGWIGSTRGRSQLVASTNELKMLFSRQLLYVVEPKGSPDPTTTSAGRNTFFSSANVMSAIDFKKYVLLCQHILNSSPLGILLCKIWRLWLVRASPRNIYWTVTVV